MQYRYFGKMGIQLSALGFGAMRLPTDEDQAVRVIHHAFDLGVNYIDTAPGYGESERVVGRALREYSRKTIYLSTKNPLEDGTAAGWRARLERSLERLGVDHIHFYQSVHALNWEAFQNNFSKSGALDQAIRARDEGLIGHICFSFHDSAENLIRLIDTGLFEGFTVQYNLLDRSCEDAITYAQFQGMGVVVMGPVGGGRLMEPSEKIREVMDSGRGSTPHAAIRFVLAHPGVTSTISGMSTLEMVDENCAAASESGPLSEQEWLEVLGRAGRLKELAELYCTGCGYCMPCPNGVNIPENFRLMNLHRVWGQTQRAERGYARLGQEGARVPGMPASDCLECGECEPKCPQNIPIIQQLRDTAAALAPLGTESARPQEAILP